jgi:hypothetical protein
MKTRYKELEYRKDGPTLWRICETPSSEANSAIGPHYRTKAELLADLERFAAEFGCEDAQKVPTMTNSEPEYTHTEPILAYRQELETELEALLNGDEEAQDALDARFLDLDIFTGRRGDIRAELVLGVGGPTIWIEWDSRWFDAVLHHSWGHGPDGKERTRCGISGGLIERVLEALGVEVQA